MIKKTVEKAINDQIKQEIYSAYLYLSMSAYCESVNLSGLAHWMRIQFDEEMAHALRLFDFLINRGGRVTLQAIEKPPADFASPLEIFQQALEHEKNVTAMIEKLYETAAKENDYATQVELQWFISEQVEEEKSAGAIVEQLKLVGKDNAAMLMLDRQLASRTVEKVG
jgi:ferritin